MRIVIQRVRAAAVAVAAENLLAAKQELENRAQENQVAEQSQAAPATPAAPVPPPAPLQEVARIDAGLCVLVGITHTDTDTEIEKIARKICELKLLRATNGDDDPAARQSVLEAGASVLLVSQFTLYANVRKGKKPSWSAAAGGEQARPIFEKLVQAVRARGVNVETGVFGAMMQVQITNDGPFTIVYEV